MALLAYCYYCFLLRFELSTAARAESRRLHRRRKAAHRRVAPRLPARAGATLTMAAVPTILPILIWLAQLTILHLLRAGARRDSLWQLHLPHLL